MMKYIPIFYDYIDELEELTDEEAGRIFKAAMYYGSGKKDYESVLLSLPERELRLAFKPLKKQIDRSTESYKNRVEQNRENGKKGGRPPKENPNNPLGFEKTEKTQEEEKEKEKNKEKEKKEKPPLPPSTEDDDRENERVYARANECGLPTTKAIHDTLKNMIDKHGQDKVMSLLEKGASAKQFPKFVDFP